KPSLQTEVAKFGAVGAAVPPPAEYSYSNPGYNTLGATIEIVSGKPLDVFLRDEIYRPLGMVDTYHHETEEGTDGKLNRMGAVYYERENGRWVPGWRPGDEPQVPFVRASGGLISTAWDYAIFLQTFLNGGSYGSTTLLKPTSVERMTSRHTPDGGPAYGYGWGLQNGQYGHSGSDGTYAWVDPERGIIAMVLTQTPRGRNPIAKFRQMVELAVEDEGRVATQREGGQGRGLSQPSRDTMSLGLRVASTHIVSSLPLAATKKSSRLCLALPIGPSVQRLLAN